LLEVLPFWRVGDGIYNPLFNAPLVQAEVARILADGNHSRVDVGSIRMTDWGRLFYEACGQPHPKVS
jgi:hypothetical protein